MPIRIVHTVCTVIHSWQFINLQSKSYRCVEGKHAIMFVRASARA